MYNDYYGFRTDPFHIIPNIELLFMSPKFKQALSCMEFGLMRDIGLMLVTGEVGIGKTTLIRFFLDHVEEEVRTASIFNTNVSPDQLLGMILQEFGVGVQTDNKVLVLQALQEFLLEMRSQDLRPLLIIDDAQNLSAESLEEVRLMSNLQDDDRALLQILLVGQPELKAKIANPAMLSFAQRIGVNYHLGPFTEQETVEYITHRLKAVDGSPDLFTPEALELIYKAAVGIPRAINLLCDNVLVYGFVDELSRIDERIVQQVIEEVGALFPWFGPQATLDPESNLGMPGTDSAAAHPHRGKKAGPSVQGDWQRLESRVAALERLVGIYTRELHDLIKSQLVTDRHRADKLLIEYTRMKLKMDSLLKSKISSGNGSKRSKTSGDEGRRSISR
jgi:general secretion pathway protein A